MPSTILRTPVVLAFALVLAAGLFIGMNFQAQGPTYLMVQESIGGSFRAVNAASGTYTLTLNGLRANTLLFTDRPQRMVASRTTKEFLETWKKGADSFAKDPPNAVLITHNATGNNAVVVELSNPVYKASNNSLTYNATVLKDGNTRGLVPSPVKDATDFPRILQQPALFIDDAGNGMIW